MSRDSRPLTAPIRDIPLKCHDATIVDLSNWFGLCDQSGHPLVTFSLRHVSEECLLITLSIG